MTAAYHDKQNLHEFVRHLYLECIYRYRKKIRKALLNESLTAAEETALAMAEENAGADFFNGTTMELPPLEEEDIAGVLFENTNATDSVAESFITANSPLDGEWENVSDMFNASHMPECPLRFDGYLCWPPTPAGTVLTQNCPDFVEGFNSKLLAHKTCLPNGTWLHHPESRKEWSNYTNCVDYEDFEFRTLVNELYIKGYAISLLALVLSLLIFLGFKSLRCTRIRIHVHLFASLACTCVAWIMWYKLVVERPEMIRYNPAWCIALHLLIHYFMLVNYFWMFCEGMHLHLVLVVVFVKDTIVMRWFMLISWISPILFVNAYSVARYFSPDENRHCWMDDSYLLWIFSIPICFSLVASFVFLINVLRVIVRKLHPQSAQPAPLAIRKAVRATIILIPLFGLQHFLLPYRPDAGTQLERIYQILSVVLVSLQGFVVSFLFCFANQDVTYAVRSLFNRLLPGIVAAPPPSTHTAMIATTTPSRELGV